MSDIASGDMGPWLSPEDLEFVRRKVPMVYVDVVPIRTDEVGRVESIGLLLEAQNDGISRALVTGRVLYHESIREAIARHLEKDLGPMSLPQLPPSIAPFTVAEYFPTPGADKFDERQHAVSLCYIVPMLGECDPAADTLEVTWFTPGEVRTPELQAEMSESHAQILRQALGHMGCA
ncbi:NUDIX hydrolase family protein [Flaviflexus equikiangi]|nr:NUDIX hydrolase family protein [Flaviflexus equikiangi]